MTNGVTALLLMTGGLFMFLAALGVARQPDLFTRMQAATKAVALGSTCILIAVAVYFADLGITTRALLVSVFIYLTAPISAHLMARAAYFVGVPLWEGTVVDELRGRYNRHTHTLQSEPEAAVTPPTSSDEAALQG